MIRRDGLLGRWVKQTILPLGTASLFAAAASAQTELSRVQLPSFARAVTIDDQGHVVASLALQGTAVLRVEGDTIRLLTVMEDVPSLGSYPTGNGRFAVAGRFGSIAALQIVGDRVTETARWPIETHPVSIHQRGADVFVAAGGAGILRFHWPDDQAEPTLTARYPFVDFSKEIDRQGDNVLHVADNLDTGLQTLELVDEQRIRSVVTIGGDFIDSLHRADEVMAVAHRRRGAALFDVSDPMAPRFLLIFPPGVTADGEPSITIQVRLSPSGGRLFAAEGAAGATLRNITLGDDGPTVTGTVRRFNAPEGAISSGVFVGEDRLITVGAQGTLQLWRLDS